MTLFFQCNNNTSVILESIFSGFGNFVGLNPFLHIGHFSVRIYGQNFDFKIRRDNKKNPMSDASISR